MSKIHIYFAFFIFWFTHLDCEIQQNRPKIKTSDGDLILEPAFDKNIYLLPNGPKSNIFVGEVNLLKADTTKASSQYVPSSIDDFGKYLNGPNGILKRLERLESGNTVFTEDLLLNTSRLWRKVNNLNRKVLSLQMQLTTRGRDECQSQPCQHGGTCLNLANGYYCLCPSNWEGRDCDIDVNECRNFAGTDLGCQNAATCINRPGSYECLCRSGWYGLHCTRKAKDCSGGDFEMCGHGTCINVQTGEGVKCICHQGWTTNDTGSACLTDINECDAHQGPSCSVNPKVECINTPGSFRCGQCPSGYQGDGYSCSDVDECVTIPNGGCSPMVACHNTVGSRICGTCPPGYQGDGVMCSWRGSCNINHGGCHPSAQCIDTTLGAAGSQCICPDGMEGDGVGLQGCLVSTGGNFTQGCETNPCGAHGQCHRLRTGYTCICFKGFSGAHCDISTSSCAANPCLHGGVCIPDDTIPRGFRCECTAQYSGPLCQMLSKTCGGVLDNEEGNIIYPLSNTTYNHNARCAWVIHTTPDKVINVTFTKFNLELSPECTYDFLQIHDGRSSASQFIGRFCGKNVPNGGNIISSHNNLYFWFRSDNTVAKEGFALNWKSISPVCGGEIDATTHGHISSPGSPGKYPPNRDCFWHLTTTLSKRIQLHFYALDIESHPNCSYDYLAIYDGEHITDPLLNMYCNSTQPAPVESAGSDILIHFHSDAYGSGNGFQITYSPIEGVPGCGGYFTVDKGEIVSPSFNGNYLNNLLCEYKIKTSGDTRIRIDFKNFKLESSFRCRYDYLKIYDGPSSESRLVGRFCGNSYPKSYISSSNMLFFKFKTDLSTSSDGFRITYEAICHKTVLGDSGVIKSPGYPFTYPENRVCDYVITATPGKIIQLTFQDFDIENNTRYDCLYDHVDIRDGPDVNSTLLGTFCGGLPPVQTSSHNYMYVKFFSDPSISGTGFYANYTSIDAECGGIYRATTGLINHPREDGSTYNNDQTCNWILIAPEGMHIKLTWNRFDLENMPRCGSDYLELIEIDENNENNVLAKFCGVNAPPALTTSTNRLMIKFVSDVSVRSAGFSVSYTFLDEKTHCDGVYVKSHGFIYSPGWPKSYEPNRDCTWTITVPVGQQIRLNISQFDLERPIRDKCNLGDYLEIRNGASQNAPLIAQLCGKFQSRRIVSMANILYLRFHSDFYLTGNGFKIEWDGSTTGCGGTLTSSTGSISSPNYPNDYNENAECFYKIVTSPGSRIRISFTELDLERTHKCRDDYVEIFDGRDVTAATLGKHCSMSPDLSNIETSTNYAVIKFRSDFYIGGKGFFLSYSTICHNNVTGRYGVIESPDFPGNYPLHLDCLWTINVSKGNKINVTFTHFDIYRSFRRRNWWSNRHSRESCDVDYVQTKELSDISYSNKLCGSTLPEPLSTKGNTLQLKFATGFIPRTGFRLEWISYGCGGHIQKASGTITLDRSSTSVGEMECEWLIETSIGKSVYISFSDLYMTDNINCTVDAIEIYNGPDVKSPLLSRICHRGKTSMRSTANFMLVRLVKRSSIKDVYFDSTFSSSQAACGGSIEALSGYIYSKNYPKNYDDNLDCMWIITVPNKHRVELNIMDMDLYSTFSYYDDDEDTACGDSIKIYDNLYSNYTHRICPDTNVSQIISKTNKLKIQFTTNGYGNAKGFKANFTTVCGSIITALYDGIITNDMNNLTKSCTWTILASRPDQKISLTITHMSLQNIYGTAGNRSCSSSFLRVFDGNDKEAPLVDEFCGRKVPPMIVSHGSALTVELGTYSGQITGQFSAHYSPLSNACGGTLTSEEGSIASPNYPRHYPPDTNCEWILSTSPGNKVYITFERFNLEYADGCNEDYLEVRENDGGGRILGVYCGNDIPITTPVASKIYIKFHSNNQNNGNGFLIHYGFLHGSEITGESGVVSSPLYPFPYQGPGEYSWRITTSGAKTLSLNINNLEIQSFGLSCSNKLSIYDGYDESAPLVEELCGILTPNIKVIQTTSNAAYIKLFMDESNTGSMFRITWANADRSTADVDSGDVINCGYNNTELISPGLGKVFESPNYPDNYGSQLHCVWTFESPVGYHLNLRFIDFQIEETNGCFADSVSIFYGDSPNRWKPLKENVCTSESVSGETNSSRYLKVVFKTDTSVARKGFQGHVLAVCGGLLTDPAGIIGLTESDVDFSRTYNRQRFAIRCDWTVKVRTGRVIKLKFEHFNISNINDCSNAVILHNGESVESPMLASGKYCGYEHENKEDITTSSNALFISYICDSFKARQAFQNFKIRYEEKNKECGFTTKLDSDKTWEVINSPNYPAVSIPYSECTWVLSGPPGEILRIDFIDRFDLDDVDDCATEVVEIRDGLSELSPRIGRFCSDNPGTVKTTSNTVHIKYLTQLAEPRNGFKANVSIYTCGGTIVSNTGEVLSPSYPHLQVLPYGSVCEWRIIGSRRNVFLIKPQDVNLPDSESPCETKITIEEKIPANDTTAILRTFCNDDIEDTFPAVETSTNEVIIKFYIGKPSEWTQTSEHRGFRFTFNSSRPVCGEMITTPEGYLSTPSYPLETTLRYCQWHISVPNKMRRVRLELLDADTQKHKIGIFNDPAFQSVIYRLPEDGNLDPTNQTFESSSNKLAIYLWLNPSTTRHRFKAKFSSNEPALCGGDFTGISGQLISPAIDRSYICEWRYNNKVNISSNNGFNTIYLTGNVNSSVTRNRCRFYDPKLTIRSAVTDNGLMFTRNICGHTEVSYRIPSSIIDFKATKSKSESFYFHLDWKSQPCGGIVNIERNPINVLDVPSYFNDSIDCAWILLVPMDNKVELKFEGSFKLECDDEYVKIYRSLTQYSQIIGDYCKNKMMESPIVTNFRSIFVEYHSKAKNNTDLKLMAKTVIDECGGIVFSYESVFASPNYPNNYEANQECAWEIKAELGNRISLQFIDRFVVEDRPNCTKDAVFVYDWKDDTYTEIARLCGRQLPPSYNSTFNRMKIVLRTDADTNLDGFKARWTPLCGGHYTATETEQILYSPGFPYQYQPLLSCSYEISASDNKVIVEFLEFELEGTYPDCIFDNLTIVGESRHDYYNEVFCGSELPSPMHFDKISLTFKTDRYIQRKGFKLSYKTFSCGGPVNTSTVLSSNELENYHENLNCTWFIEAPTDKVVILKFIYIDLEDSYECEYDYISVYNDLIIDDSKRLALICGTVNSTTILRSHGNKMLLQFISDASMNLKGFKVAVFFSYSESVGCGGQIDLTAAITRTLKSPLIGSNVLYENYLDCQWTIKSPIDTYIKIEFTSFHVSSCKDVNQTAIGFSNCDCDFIEVKDGINPNSIGIGTYCGHTLPPQLISSKNIMSVRLSTDGEIASSGFEARLTVQQSLCGQSLYTITYKTQRMKSPGYETGSIPRGLHCAYHFDATSEPYSTIRLTISVDLLPPSTENSDGSHCTKDRLLVTSFPHALNTTTEHDIIIRSDANDFFARSNFYDKSLPAQFELCGLKPSIDFYVLGNININLITSADTESSKHKGVQIEVAYTGFCGRNYTEPQGRIQATHTYEGAKLGSNDCYTLISAPENHTISVYFLNIIPVYWNENYYFDVYDGDKTNAPKLVRIQSRYDNNYPIFSTGRFLLFNNHALSGLTRDYEWLTYDLNYITTDKGRGCGGKLINEMGKVTSPLYPEVYRNKSTCEWELETPSGTHLFLTFSVFDLGINCDHNYVQLVDSQGNVISTFCSETPADYTSKDNYVKIVFVTTVNNGGTGWVADFLGIR